MRCFGIVYNWSALILFSDVWIDREITALEAENLINQLAEILEVPVNYDTRIK